MNPSYIVPGMFGWLVDLCCAWLGKMLLRAMLAILWRRCGVRKTESAVAILAQVRRGTPNFHDAWIGRGHAPLPIFG